VSSLWTPEGEHSVPRPPAEASGSPAHEPPSHPGPGDASSARDPSAEHDEDKLASQLEDLRQQLAATPAEVVVANHAYGLFELAAIHLGDQPPRLDAARLAVDALGALVEGLTGRLGEAEGPLTEALAQVRLAYVQIGAAAEAESGDGAKRSSSGADGG
jgi:hypothetical protein